jgi:hypothetical protein
MAHQCSANVPDWQGLRGSEDENMAGGYVCAICEEDVSRRDGDAIRATLSNVWREDQARPAQEIYVHGACLKAALAPSVPFDPAVLAD